MSNLEVEFGTMLVTHLGYFDYISPLMKSHNDTDIFELAKTPCPNWWNQDHIKYVFNPAIRWQNHKWCVDLNL